MSWTELNGRATRRGTQLGLHSAFIGQARQLTPRLIRCAKLGRPVLDSFLNRRARGVEFSYYTTWLVEVEFNAPLNTI